MTQLLINANLSFKKFSYLILRSESFSPPSLQYFILKGVKRCWWFFSFVIVIFSYCYNILLFFPVVITSCYIFRYAALFNFSQFSLNVIFVYCKPYVYIFIYDMRQNLY